MNDPELAGLILRSLGSGNSPPQLSNVAHVSGAGSESSIPGQLVARPLPEGTSSAVTPSSTVCPQSNIVFPASNHSALRAPPLSP